MSYTNPLLYSAFKLYYVGLGFMKLENRTAVLFSLWSLCYITHTEKQVIKYLLMFALFYLRTEQCNFCVFLDIRKIFGKYRLCVSYDYRFGCSLGTHSYNNMAADQLCNDTRFI